MDCSDGDADGGLLDVEGLGDDFGDDGTSGDWLTLDDGDLGSLFCCKDAS